MRHKPAPATGMPPLGTPSRSPPQPLLLVILISCCWVQVAGTKWPIFTNDLKVKVTCDGPAVLDAPITFNASIYDSYGSDTSHTQFFFVFSDDTKQQHKMTTDPSEATSVTYTVTYPASEYRARLYTMFVDAYWQFWTMKYKIGSAHVQYNITDNLMGGIEVNQRGKSCRENCDVSTSSETEFRALLYDPFNFFHTNATLTYFWLVDHINYGPRRENYLRWNFTKQSTYTVEAIVVAELNNTDDGTEKEDIGGNSTVSDFTGKDTRIGIFQMEVDAEDPVSSVVVSGQTWLKHGDLLNLNVSCKGTPPWSYCFHIRSGSHNVTDNETCTSTETTTTTDCQFFIIRYFPKATSYTVAVVIENDVSKKVQGIPINIYFVSKQQQLSVIIIPLTCTVFAVIIVIFGVAYYIQNRRRFSVEVADFDFGQSEDIEYKTFYEHLQESIVGAFKRNPRGDEEPLCDDNNVSFSKSSLGSLPGANLFLPLNAHTHD